MHQFTIEWLKLAETSGDMYIHMYYDILTSYLTGENMNHAYIWNRIK